MSEHHHDNYEEPSISGLTRRITEHVETRIEYARLSLYEKLAIVMVKRHSMGIMIGLLVFVLMFISVAGGMWLGKLYGDYAIGFGIIGAIYFGFLLIYLLLRKSVFEKKMLDSVITSLCAEQEDEDEDEEA